jgi:3-oxoacyl-(acyl-carrier-protein) synthase
MAAPAWDRSELAGVASALRDLHRVFPNIAPICTSSKPYFCHTFSSAFVLDAAAAALSLHEGFVFPLPVPPDLPGTDGLFSPGVTTSSHPFAIALGHGLGGNAGGVLLGRV